MKTDIIFYRLFKSFPSIFFELIGQGGEEARYYDFTSVEIKELAFRLDGVFLPRQGRTNTPIYYVEVQFQPNDELYARLFAEIFVYLYQYKPEADWRSVVIYPRRSLDTGVPIHYQELFDSGRITRLYLDELAETEKQTVGIRVAQLVVEKAAEATETTRHLLTQVELEIDSLSTKRGLIELIETIMVYKFPAKSRQEIAIMLGLSELRHTKVFQEGVEEGRREGYFIAIELGLELKFGGEGLRLMPEIKKIEDVDVLATVYEGLKIVHSLNELRQIYSE